MRAETIDHKTGQRLADARDHEKHRHQGADLGEAQTEILHEPGKQRRQQQMEKMRGGVGKADQGHHRRIGFEGGGAGDAGGGGRHKRIIRMPRLPKAGHREPAANPPPTYRAAPQATGSAIKLPRLISATAAALRLKQFKLLGEYSCFASHSAVPSWPRSRSSPALLPAKPPPKPTRTSRSRSSSPSRRAAAPISSPALSPSACKPRSASR